ncbi:uncharacterized protein EV420DRAFT_1480531 [Desarmillaria tabescens]|uniref:Uncharacterized protein n=1 Tax=Armillaria tabescens TaxID=1929756 RepID=A0AA39N4S9_ARMTA|nr:uncharacterized protein EV420DRAFT_1480531 [Desarmillaria tabescens]KAK0457458.1 hypothetical protein EV420DRAFT_1480531 [Desarmillaria tabescens]
MARLSALPSLPPLSQPPSSGIRTLSYPSIAFKASRQDNGSSGRHRVGLCFTENGQGVLEDGINPGALRAWPKMECIRILVRNGVSICYPDLNQGPSWIEGQRALDNMHIPLMLPLSIKRKLPFGTINSPARLLPDRRCPPLSTSARLGEQCLQSALVIVCFGFSDTTDRIGTSSPTDPLVERGGVANDNYDPRVQDLYFPSTRAPNFSVVTGSRVMADYGSLRRILDDSLRGCLCLHRRYLEDGETNKYPIPGNGVIAASAFDVKEYRRIESGDLSPRMDGARYQVADSDRNKSIPSGKEASPCVRNEVDDIGYYI